MSVQPATALARGTVARGDHEKNIGSCLFHCTVCPHTHTRGLEGSEWSRNASLPTQAVAQGIWPTTSFLCKVTAAMCGRRPLFPD